MLGGRSSMVEHLFVEQRVEGSSPSVYPTYNIQSRRGSSVCGTDARYQGLVLDIKFNFITMIDELLNDHNIFNQSITVNTESGPKNIPFRTPPPIINHERVPTIKYKVSSVPNGNNKLIELINSDLSAFLKDFKPLPSSMLDLTKSGVRGLSGTHPLVPNRIIHLSGLFLVKAIHNFDNSVNLNIEPPDLSIKTYDVLKMGYMIVAKDGVAYGISNTEPFGAYSIAAMENKVEQTIKYGSVYNVKIEAYGSHESNPDLAWIIYTTAENIMTPMELFWVGINTDETNSLYQSAMYKLGQELRNLHQTLGITHGQIHPGNWLINIEKEGEFTIVLKDWSTVMEINNLPEPPESVLI